MTRTQLERYLKMVLDVHVAMYELEKAFDSVELRKGSLGKAANIVETKVYKESHNLQFPVLSDIFGTILADGFFKGIIIIISAFCMLAAIISFFINPRDHGETFLQVLLVEMGIVILCILIKIIFHIIKKITASNDYSKKKNNSVIVYQQALAQDASRVEHENKIIAALNFEQDTMRINYSILKDKLQKLYNQNIIFDGYRNMIAVAQFYEYIASGMCDRLEGANGAYQQYQNFVNAGRICERLDRISSQLDVIQRNQRMLYNAVMNIQQSLNNIENSLGRMEMSLNDIQQKVQRLTSAAVSAEQYMKETHQALQSIAKSVHLDALNTQVIALNNRREAIANGVDAYFLEYPSSY